MEKTNHFDYSRPLAYEDIQQRKQEVLAQIRGQQQVIKKCLTELVDDYAGSDNLFSIRGVRKVSGWIGGAFYAYRIFRSISRVTGFLHRH